MLNNKKNTKAQHNFNINEILCKLHKSSQNAKITFLQRMVYKEDDPKVLLGMAKKSTEKLKLMGIFNGNSIPIDTEGLKSALDEYESGNNKFYTKKSTEQCSIPLA
jgi:hypothetical protein